MKPFAIIVTVSVIFFSFILIAGDLLAAGQEQLMTSIHVSSFKSQSQAQRELIRLQSFGVAAFTRHEPVQGKGMWFRVYIGRFDSRQQALAYAQELKQKGIISWSLVKRIKRDVPVAKPAPPPRERIVPKERPVTPPPPPKPVPKPPEVPMVTEQKREPSVPAVTEPAPPPKPRVVTKPVPEKVQEPPPSLPDMTFEPIARSRQPGRFSMGIRGDTLYAASISDFRITRTTGSSISTWKFREFFASAALAANLRVSDRWSFDAAVGQVVMSELNMPFITLGAKVHFTKSGSVRPYFRAAALYANMSWDQAPGDFDSAVGGDIELGIDYVRSRFSIGLGAGYRQLSFDYKLPADPTVTATKTEIDFSGLVVTGVVRYHF